MPEIESSDLSAVPMYIAEVSPAKYRGRMIGLDNMSITGGQLISYGIGAAFASTRGGWRYMVGGGAIPAIVLCALLPFCPESPRQLIYHGKEDEAKDSMRLEKALAMFSTPSSLFSDHDEAWKDHKLS